MTHSKIIRVLHAAGVTAMLLPAAATAGPAEDFYKDRELTMVVGCAAGCAYDVYTRVLTRHWINHLPGKPHFVVQNMPGAGGIKATNYIANKAKKDGSVVGATFAAILIDSVIDPRNRLYDPRTINWLGSISPQFTSCFVNKKSGINRLEDAMNREVIMGATSANSSSAVLGNLYNVLLGTKFKVITGYSTAGNHLAVERAEVDGTCLSYATVKSSAPQLIEKNMLNWLVVLNDKPVKELPNVPPASKFLKTDEQRQILKLLIARVAMGRPYLAPPEVPADRLTVLRETFMETLKDETFLADAEKAQMVVDPSDHTEMEKLVASVYALPKEITKKTFALMNGAIAAAKKGPKVKK